MKTLLDTEIIVKKNLLSKIQKVALDNTIKRKPLDVILEYFRIGYRN